MRKRFEQQLTLGQLPIEETWINPQNRYALDELLAALKEIHCNKEYNKKGIQPFGNAYQFREEKDRQTGNGLMVYFCPFGYAWV